MTKRVCLIAGGSGEIGCAIAKRLSSDSVHVCITYKSGKERAEKVVDEINSSGGSAEALPLDLSDSDQIGLLCEDIYQKHGALDVLVNAAAINCEASSLGMDDDDWNAVVDVNLSGAFRLCREAGKFMVLNRWGRIINISSISAHLGGRGQINYGAAKAGLERMTEILALELGRKGLTANCVAPGVIETAMSARIREEHSEQLLDLIPVKRFGTPDDVASVVAFLASDDASYVNGQTIRVDGGMGR